ncbi:MAG: hypothetical protein WAM70_07430 [Pyrinomonadaceae bacterium]
MPLTTVVEQLNKLANSLSIITNALGPIEPGQKVEFNLVSSIADMSVSETLATIPLDIPVKVQVKWTVEDENGNQLTGADFFTPSPLTTLNVFFLFKPPIIDLGVDAPDLVLRTVKATVTVKSFNLTDPQTSTPRDLQLPVQLVPLELPTILALFRHTKFRPFDDGMKPGFSLVVVPNGSPIQGLTEPTNEVLRRIEGALRPLRTFVGIAGFLTGLAILSQALAAQPIARVRAGNIIDLEDISMRLETFLGSDQLNRDMRPDDDVGSLIFIGPPGRTVACYNNDHFAEDQGAFKLHVGLDMVVLIPALGVAISALEAIPGVDIIRPDTDLDRFENSMTSVQFLADTPN